MADGFLSQEEIDALLNGSGSESETSINNDIFTDQDCDLLGEVGNISMGSASTALSQVINRAVNITTPVVTLTTIAELKNQFEVPNILLDVEYTSGIMGKNILIMKIPDAAVIANLMMGGDGLSVAEELSEIEVSAVQEAMNQMIGSAATSMATMFAREVNISPPTSKLWDSITDDLSEDLDDHQLVTNISFDLKIDDLVDSTIMQVLPVDTAKKIIAIMMGEESVEQAHKEIVDQSKEDSFAMNTMMQEVKVNDFKEKEAIIDQIEVNSASFESLDVNKSSTSYDNIDLIMDVPLEVSVILGKTKKSIKEVLSFGVGSVIELEKLADEPVEILVNGKQIAQGEVVVIDENFGVRITNIATGIERIKSLK